MYDIKALNEEIQLISDPDLKNFAVYCLEKVPSYFWKVAASSSGNHHPEKSNGDGGLIRHIKAAVYIGCKLCDVYGRLDLKDRTIIAILLHDAIKYGLPKQMHTVKNHPFLGADFIVDTWAEYIKEGNNPIDLNGIDDAVFLHMGRWTPVEAGIPKVEFPKDFDVLSQIVHLSDVLSSMKQIDVKSVKWEK